MSEHNKFSGLDRIPSKEDFAIAFNEGVASDPVNPTKVGIKKSSNTISDPFIGRTIQGKYKVEKLLGGGGMGNVYLATHNVIGKQVAIKVLHPELTKKSTIGKRFLREAKASSSINHENVVDVMDFGETEDGYAYMVMEFLQGIELGKYVHEKGIINWQEARDIIIQVCRALAAAHAQDIIHRDIKPSNIFLIEFAGKKNFVKLIDFGIAKVGQEDDGEKMTKTGTIMGTPDYMSPEQAGGKELTNRSDIYSTGIILYELVTGMVPFDGDSFMAVLSRHLFDEPPRPNLRNPKADIPTALENIILKALEKRPEDRFASMNEFIEALESIKDTGEGKTIVLNSVKRKRNQMLSKIALAVLFTAVFAGVFGFLAMNKKHKIIPTPDFEPSIVNFDTMNLKPVVETTEINIITDQKDAEIILENGTIKINGKDGPLQLGKGTVLGRTPLENYRLIKSSEKLSLRIIKTGFEPLIISLVPDTKVRIEKTMTKKVEKAPTMRPVPQTMKPEVMKPSENVDDNSGELLTPMF
ncbi:serine/threonine protein kinase [Myxococcota bacterium]|nr:serine/threonine protein kinase [Myxococcota bacterium]MBU1379582.1 serine/threonine protein kinase [Myxococcota bacterium]MBU1498339.1 serine/threonine protein kinase [Myxococcota bacterium]